MHNILACYYRCKEDKLCQSLNFYEKKNLCELNNRTRAAGSVNFLSYADSVYLDNPFRGKHFDSPVVYTCVVSVNVFFQHDIS